MQFLYCFGEMLGSTSFFSCMQANTGHGALYIVMLAIDIIAALLHSVAAIADRSSLSFSFSNLPLPTSEPSATNLTLPDATPQPHASRTGTFQRPSPGATDTSQHHTPHASPLMSNFTGNNSTPHSNGGSSKAPVSPTTQAGATAFLPNLTTPQTPSLSHPSIAVSSSVSLGRDTPPRATLATLPTPRLTPVTSNLPEESPASVSLPVFDRRGVTAALFHDESHNVGAAQALATPPGSTSKHSAIMQLAGMHVPHASGATETAHSPSGAEATLGGLPFAPAAQSSAQTGVATGVVAQPEGRMAAMMGSALPESRYGPS